MTPEDHTEARERADQSVQVTLPKSLMPLLGSYKESTRLSHPNILFDAVEYSYEVLEDLVGGQITKLPDERHKLFERPSISTRSEEETETFIVRMTPTNKQVLDDLWKRINAPSRTAMLAAAYSHYLTNMTTKDTKE